MPIETAATAPAEITGPASNYVRVAVAQIAYHPAIRGCLVDPRGKADAEGKLPSSTLPAGGAAAPEALREAHRLLSERVEAAYVEQLVRKLRGIVLACRAWDVRLLVFPEYSIPVTALSAVAAAAGEMVVVAGSCFIDAQIRKSAAYEALHSPARPGLRQNVAHVLHASKIVALVAKLHATDVEQGLELKPGTTWAPVPMPPDFAGPLGVLTCLDFLKRTSAPSLELVGPKLDQCRALAVPALTPEGSLRLFSGHYFEESGPGRRPVFFANHAPGGGSTIVAGERTLEELRAFPVHAGVLGEDEEGVLVTDVDLAVVGVGKGGRYGEVLPSKPFASASLVYAGAAPEMARWLEELRTVLPDVVGDDDEADVLERASEWIAANPPPRPGASAAQKRRWDRLLQAIEHETSVESLRRLTREVVLEPDVLPLVALESALARGASKAIHAWVLGGHLGAEPFATVSAKLTAQSGGDAGPSIEWSDQARKAWANVTDTVHGVSAQPSPSFLSPLDRATETVENQVVRAALEEGNAHVKAWRYADARASFEQVMAESRHQGEANPVHGALWSILFARGAIGAASCAVNLGDLDGARMLLEQIPIDALDPSRRVRVANVWTALGEVERARAILPPPHLISAGEDAQEARIVLQRIELIEGRIAPDIALESSPDILIPAAFILLERQDAARAARLACRALDTATENPLVRADAFRILLEAILRTAHEMNESLVPVPLDAREEIVARIEAGIREILTSGSAEPRLQALLRTWRMFLELTSDTDALAALPETSAEDSKEEETALQTAIRTAQRLANDGHVESALQTLPPDKHPWRGRLVRIDVLRSAGQADRALPDALALAAEFPGRVRIEMTLSGLLASQNRHEEALVHAQRAKDALPARGLRILVAERLLALRRGEEAWSLLLPEEGAAGPRILRALAIAADQAHPERALEIWQRYVAARPRDAEARVQVAVLLFVQNRPGDAAQEAWSTFEAHSDTLTIEHLHRLGALQGAPLPAAERKRRVLAVAACLRRQFPGNPDAEQARMSLLAEVGALENTAERIDFALLREAGVARTLTTGQLMELMQAQGQVTQMVQQLGQRGALPIALFCASVTPPITVPLVVVRLLHRDRIGVAFSAPVGLEDSPPAFKLEGAHLLVSQVELYLLAALGLLDRLKDRLSATGHIFMFRAAWLSVIDDHGLLRAQAGAERGEALERTVAALAPLPRLVPAADEVGMSDVQIAVHRGGHVLASAPSNDVRAAGNLVKIPEEQRISPRTVLGWLATQGRLSTPAVRDLEPYFAGDPETPGPIPTPTLLLVTIPFLEKLHAHGALQDLQDMFPRTRIHVGEADWQALLARRYAAMEDRRAWQLAEQVHGWIAQGMNQDLVQILPDPHVEGIPSLLDPGDDVAARLVREPLEWAASYADALVAHPEWWRLTADFFGTTAPFSLETVSQLRWKDRNVEPRALVLRLRVANRRLVSLPVLIRAMLGDRKDTERNQALWKLAVLGFTDALGPRELLALFRHYSGMEGAAARRMLDGLEWMAREPGHVGGDAARLRLAVAYAGAVFQAFCGKPSSGTEQGSAGPSEPGTAALSREDAEALGRALLVRAETLGQDTRTDFLDATVRYLAASAASSPRLAWQRDAENARWNRRMDGPLTVLWDFVLGWAGKDGARRAAYERGIREIWLLLDDGEEERRMVVSAAIVHAVEGRHAPGEVLLTDLAVEAEAILSALWEWRPTAIRGFDLHVPPPMEAIRINDEQLLAFGARPDTPLDVDFQGRFLSFAFPVSENAGAIGVVAPVEAILLRRTGEALSQLAETTLRLQGVHDGRAYRLLEGLRRHPSRVSLRRAVGRRAVSALWRAVRDDPSYLVRWPLSRGIGSRGARPSLRELRAILSEPPDLGPTGGLVGMGVLHRAFEENGIWHRRVDKGDLLKMAFEVPGELIFGSIELLLRETEYEANIEEALAIVAQSDSHPVGRVARSVVLLRAGAARRPLLKLPSGEDVDLRERLPNLLLQLLERFKAKPPKDTLAAAEPFLLRVCAQVVIDLSGPMPLPVREGLWLTYRLFQWLSEQLDAVSPEARVAGLRRLSALAPLPSKPMDRLDPRGFGLDRPGLFDHRLGTILFALATMEEPAFLSGDQSPSAKMPLRLAWQPAMLDILAELASRIEDSPGLGSELGWSAPDTIGDLAHLALLRIDPNAFLRVPAEARLARLHRLPADPESSGLGIRAFFDTLITQTALHAATIPEEERAVLLARVRALPAGKVGDRWRMLTLPSLFANGSPDVTEAEATLAVQGGIAEPLAPMALSLLLLGVAARDPARIGPVFEDVLKEAERRSVDPVPFAAGLARVSVFGPESMREVVKEVLRAVAARPPFQGDERVRELLVAIGDD